MVVPPRYGDLLIACAFDLPVHRGIWQLARERRPPTLADAGAERSTLGKDAKLRARYA